MEPSEQLFLGDAPAVRSPLCPWKSAYLATCYPRTEGAHAPTFPRQTEVLCVLQRRQRLTRIKGGGGGGFALKIARKSYRKWKQLFVVVVVVSVVVVVVVVLLFRAGSAACGSSQARGQIRAAAAGLHHSHSNTRSKPHL